VISSSDDHIFIRITKQKQHFWSPQLHLEIISLEEQKSFLQGFFSPNPTVWTMFMFFHFVVAILFLGFSIWTYTNYTLHSSFALQLAGMFFMILIWIGLYFGGRMGKLAGKKEMHAQYDFMKKRLGMA
jgi:hypothetical protein